MITIFLFSLTLLSIGIATITAFKSSVLERKILELESELKKIKNSL